ncbi:MAG: C25 family cysteine peptidase [Euryarchaeota archaeon]|nr:C25 family cysteine peptidase [Euryarchaeota archaeon]
MRKNDKIIIAVGIIVILITVLGVYTWVPESLKSQSLEMNDFFNSYGTLTQIPAGVVVSDQSPFYALIATPLAVHYNSEKNQQIIPLYVSNFSSPSRAIIRTMDEIPRDNYLYLDSSKSPKEWSIEIAKTYWTHSDAVLLIPQTEEGYNLGVLGAPIASYLSIPVIVTNDIDTSIRQLFTDLGVTKTIVCGDTLSGYGTTLTLTSVDQIVNATTTLVREKFGSVNYITITNPSDAWPPEVLASEKYVLGPKKMTTKASTELLKSFKKQDNVVGTFTIPKDYKYALVKFKGINLNVENVDELGDTVNFACGPVPGQIPNAPSGLESFEVYAGGTNAGGIPVRDAQGHIVEDVTYSETVLYDRGGIEYQVTANPSWLASNEGDVKAEIIVEKLSDPLYPMMNDLSSLAPYLTAYHKGIVFGKPTFAYAADDDVLYMGKPSPGFFSPCRNPVLTGAFNDHVFKIHDEINQLLANLAGISLEKERDIENLQKYYEKTPLYVTLVGDGTMLPQLIYDSSIDPIFPIEDVSYYFGGGVPSDVIYGNIDPNPGDWTSQAPDLYTEYPFQENIVGRITGWDAQDASALIARTVFYNDIIDNMGEWKNNAVIQMGGGNDFQKPFLRYKIFGEILNLIRRGEPMKMETGASYLNGLTLQKTVLEPLGFTTEYVRENKAAYQGFSNDAITKLKKANLLNMLLLSERQLKNEVGTDVVNGKELQENSNFILANAHGNQHMFGMGDVGMYKLGLGLPNGILPKILSKIATIMGYGPGLSLSDHGYYSTRNVENMDLGPSFLFIESCICGKLDGMYPKQVITQAYLHSGANCVIASTTSSNIAGGYLEPKQTKYDFPGQTLLRYLKANRDATKGNYPDMHFGFKIYEDICGNLKENNDLSIGEAFRKARNDYLPSDVSWKVWWSPPLVITGFQDIDAQLFQKTAQEGASGLDTRLDNKYMSFQEYTLYGDPAFVPYVPGNN